MTSTSLRTAGTATGEPALRLDGVVKAFGDVVAVDGLDLTVEPGEIVAFLGPNGAGKTSTLDMVLGLSKPTQGRVSVFGTDPVGAVTLARTAAVMQTGGLLKDLTVRETVQLAASLHRNPDGVDGAMQRAGITAIADRRVDRCSGGEQQRLRFALALIPEPDLLILDEPTTGMDVEARRSFWAAIRKDAERGRTVIFATHYLDEADAYAQRILMIRRGRIVADGSANEIRATASGRTVRATLPDPDPSALAGIPGVTNVEVNGDVVQVRTGDSDAVLRHLLNHTAAHDLEVTSHTLEDAFVALTADTSDLDAATTDPEESR